MESFCGGRSDVHNSVGQQDPSCMPSFSGRIHSQIQPQEGYTETERISGRGQDFDRQVQPVEMHEVAASVTSYRGPGTGEVGFSSSALDLFVCAICNKIMVDPVVVASGQTYDWACFSEWIEMGNTTCPLTCCPLSQFDFIPNLALKNLISSLCDSSGFILENGSFRLGCPHDFLCAICRRIMDDPVVVASGQTYDRACFHNWLNAGNNLCPITGKVLSHYESIPNLSLKDLISAWWNACPLPSDFSCGICNRLMIDPVVIPSGQSYDKACFKAWLDEGNIFCPITGKTLSHFGYFPNLALRELITMWGNTFGSLFTGNDAFLSPPPSHIICGICERIMEDPVVVTTGQTFDKFCFQRWLKEGNTHCPITNGPLSDNKYIPNLGLNGQISSWWSTSPPPESFICAICNKILEHPVVAASGYTFDRACFKVWIGAGNRQCPISCQPLAHHKYIRNHSIRNLIFSWWNASESDTALSRNPVVSISSKGNTTGPVVRALHSESTSSSSSKTMLKNDSTQPISPKHTHEQSTMSGCQKYPQLLSGSSENIDLSFSIDGTSYAESSHSRNLSLVEYSFWSDAAGLHESSSETFQRTENKHMTGSPNSNSHGEVHKEGRNELAVEEGVNESAHEQEVQNDNHLSKIQTLVSLLQSEEVHEQRNAAAELRILSRDKDENRVSIANTGALKPLVALLHSKDEPTQTLATMTLLNLSLNQEVKVPIIEEHAIMHLVKVVKEGLSPKAKGSAALALASLAHDGDANKVKIGLAGAIPPLIELLASGPERGKKDAAAALHRLSSVNDNKLKMVRAGIVRILLNFLSDNEDNMIEKSMSLIRSIVSIEAGRVAIVVEGGITIILRSMRTGSSVRKAIGVTILLQVCKHSARHRAIVLKAEPVPILIPLQQTRNPQRKAEIDELLQLLKDPESY